MQGKRVRTPIRTFRRLRPYLLVLLAIAVLAAALVLVIRQIRVLDQTDVPRQTVEQPEMAAADEQEKPSEIEPEPEAEPIPEGASKTMASGQLTVYYDDSVLTCEKKNGLLSLTYRDREHTARLDMQELSTRLDFLKDDEQDRLAIGLLQAYYYAAPPTEQITVSERTVTDGVYSCVLSAPAFEGVEAMTAYVRMDQIDGSLWYAIALLPETENSDAISAAFHEITVQK